MVHVSSITIKKTKSYGREGFPETVMHHKTRNKNKTPTQYYISQSYFQIYINQAIDVTLCYAISLVMQFLSSCTLIMGVSIPSGSTSIAKLITTPADKNNMTNFFLQIKAE